MTDKQTERMIQRAIIAELRRLGFWAVHVPNGAQLAGAASSRARQMNALKGAGLLVGFPDLIVFNNIGGIGFMEVKREGGKQTASQIKVQNWMALYGHKYAVTRSILDVNDTLKEWQWI